MGAAALPENEWKRLEELYQYAILDTPSEADFDELVQLASMICQTTLSDLTLIDAERQWFKARNIPGASQTSREVSFCAYTILQDDVFEVRDATQDERFSGNPLVLADPHIRFYAGVPLVSRNGYNLGALCVVDRTPKFLTGSQRQALRFLGGQAMKLIELHRQNREIKDYAGLEKNLREELERITDVQKTMISIIAHDVRGPLNSVKSVIEGFGDCILDTEDVVTLLPVASRHMDDTLALLDNIVDWGLLQVRKTGTSVVETTFRLRDLLDKIAASAEPRLTPKQNKLVVSADPALEVTSDVNILQFAIRNLVDNAGKFTSAGTITLSGEAIPNGFTVAVTDTGVGMEESVRVQLFQPGTTKHSSRGTDKEKGSGLGLLLCKQFIDQLGGTITVESQVGKGTTVRLLLAL